MPRVPTLATVLAATALLAPSFASAEPLTGSRFYWGVAGGRSNQDIDCAGTTDCKRAATAYKAWVGWPLLQDKGVSLELMYEDLGKAKTEAVGRSADIDAKFIGIGVAGHADFTPWLGGVARGGYARGTSKTTGDVAGAGYSVSREGTNHWYAGAGLDFAVADHVRIELGVDFTRVATRDVGGNDRTHDARAVFAGLRLAF